MFNKILIANRGEIACRIIRTCKEMGIQTVAIYSTADKEALHVALADEAVCIGSEQSSDSYLNVERILTAAVLTQSQAIHPGFGFLSENAQFAKMCAECNITFIGPNSRVIEAMGDKAVARRSMIDAGVPVIPGSKESIGSVEEGMELAEKIGFPLFIKAVAGGGGRGIRRVNQLSEFSSQFLSAQQEAKVSFGNGELYIEKMIYPAKHIEVQILADQAGHVIHLGERDCSMQRHNQKVIEEAPSPSISEELRHRIGEAAVQAARSVAYENAGTIEFLLDEQGNFYFMEMNTRIQVEHPITEMITGVDLVEWQIRIAAGEKLTIQQEDITLTGHSIECRINAEDPTKQFRPSPGKVELLHFPIGNLGVRIESAMYTGYVIPPFYDSMVAKLIVHAPTRNGAIKKMNRVLEELHINGICTNQQFLMDLLNTNSFQEGQYNTAFLENVFLNEWNGE